MTLGNTQHIYIRIRRSERDVHCTAYHSSEKISILNTIISISLHYIRAYLASLARARSPSLVVSIHFIHFSIISMLSRFGAVYCCCFISSLLIFRCRSLAPSLTHHTLPVCFVGAFVSNQISSWDAKRGKTIKTTLARTYTKQTYIHPKKMHWKLITHFAFKSHSHDWSKKKIRTEWKRKEAATATVPKEK